MEIWKELPGFPIKYQISNTGRIKSPVQLVDIGFNRIQNKPERIIKNYIGGTGYLTVGLTIAKNKSRSFQVHRLLAKVFIENVNRYKCVNHKDGNKLNNNLENLEWCSHSHNNKHAYDSGLKKPSWKATPAQVIEIRALYKYLGIPQPLIAAMYGIKQPTVSGFITNKTRPNG